MIAKSMPALSLILIRFPWPENNKKHWPCCYPHRTPSNHLSSPGLLTNSRSDRNQKFIKVITFVVRKAPSSFNEGAKGPRLFCLLSACSKRSSFCSKSGKHSRHSWRVGLHVVLLNPEKIEKECFRLAF